MTRLAILADLHGNLPALEAVEQDLAQFNVDHVIVAGDVVNGGPFQEQVATRVVANGWAVIRGNAEFYLLDYGTPRAPTEWRDLQEYPMFAWLSRQFSDRWKTVIAAWPDSLQLRLPDAPPVRVVHGSPRYPAEGIYPTSADEEIAEFLAGVDEEVVITGHTHLPLERKSGRWCIFNPGSVGMPIDGLFSASYLLLDGDERGWRPTFRRVPFDYNALFREIERQGYLETCGAMGHFFVEMLKTARPQDGFFRWRKLHYPDAPLSQELFTEYRANCQWWEYTNPAYRVNL